jgi:hypothetical protein
VAPSLLKVHPFQPHTPTYCTLSAKSLDQSLIKKLTISKSENAEQKVIYLPHLTLHAHLPIHLNTPSQQVNLSHLLILTIPSHLSPTETPDPPDSTNSPVSPGSHEPTDI